MNGLDFWNNSYAIPETEKKKYGRIVHKKILESSVHENIGKLVVQADWIDINKTVLLTETTTFLFYGNEAERFIERKSVLMAGEVNVVFGDNKEGQMAIRVNRAFESPTKEPLVFSDANGKATNVPSMDNTGVNGNYHSSSGFSGDSVWGTRNKWVSLSAVLDKVQISLAFFDNPLNPGYPAHAHARGYGLFALNNFGHHVFNQAEPVSKMELKPHQELNFKYLFLVKCGNFLTSAEADKISEGFTKGK